MHIVATRGLGREERAKRELPKSNCQKNFLGPEVLDTRLKVERRLHCLVNELGERAEDDRVEYNRVARGVTLSVGLKEAGCTRHV